MVTTFSVLCSRASFLQPVYLSAWHLGASTILVSTGLGGKGEGFPMCRVSWEHGVPTPQVPAPPQAQQWQNLGLYAAQSSYSPRTSRRGQVFPFSGPRDR